MSSLYHRAFVINTEQPCRASLYTRKQASFEAVLAGHSEGRNCKHCCMAQNTSSQTQNSFTHSLSQSGAQEFNHAWPALCMSFPVSILPWCTQSPESPMISGSCTCQVPVIRKVSALSCSWQKTLFIFFISTTVLIAEPTT